MERARAVRPDFELTDETTPIVAEICERLDAASARDRARSRLEQGAAAGGPPSPPRAPTGASGRAQRGVPARQSTLRQAIAWSYDLLPTSDRRLHARLSVFMGGFTVETAERVVASDGAGHDVLEGIASLVDRSLLRESEDAEDEPRFTMLATIREFAREALCESGEEGELLHRHALEFARFAEEADAGLRAGDQLLWFNRLETEHDNLRAALDSSLGAATKKPRCVSAGLSAGSGTRTVMPSRAAAASQTCSRGPRARRKSSEPARSTRSRSCSTSAGKSSALLN